MQNLRKSLCKCCVKDQSETTIADWYIPYGWSCIDDKICNGYFMAGPNWNDQYVCVLVWDFFVIYNKIVFWGVIDNNDVLFWILFWVASSQKKFFQMYVPKLIYFDFCLEQHFS